jgi:CubicO group peptidase (beta-lactamase class C family)
LRAYGLADLEHGIANTPATIFESGSVAKQFVGASIALLAIEGKLNIDDPVRKYITELPDYGAPLTVRHLLNHTAGVRDWGAVMALTGVGRGSRVISQVDAMDVIVRQRALDFTPGAEYSYSNSGYTLLTEIVERVSGQTLMLFTAERFFTPLGMTHSSWRDDYRRVVPGRAQAYAPVGGGWRLTMPFMNVYGNGGMLTTVNDWLKWNAMLDSRSLGGALVDSLERRGVLNDGTQIGYALGVVVGERGTHREVSHGGATAGYQTFLTRFPDVGLSIAVLCNGTNGGPGAVANAIANEILGPVPPPPAPEPGEMAAADLAKRATTWRHTKTHFPLRTAAEINALRIVGGPLLTPLRDGSFQQAQSPVRWRFEVAADGTPRTATRVGAGETDQYVAAASWTPTAAELGEFTGTWYSEEADATFTAVVVEGVLVLRQRPDTRIRLTPFDRDHFAFGAASGPAVWFTRNAAGRVDAMHIGVGRARDVPFARKAQ